MIGGNRWLKDSYPYKVVAAGMDAYLSEFFWLHSNKHPDQMFMTRVCSVMMGMCSLFQFLVNIGLVGDMWSKHKRKRR